MDGEEALLPVRKATAAFGEGIESVPLGDVVHLFGRRTVLGPLGARQLMTVAVVGSAGSGRSYVMRQLCKAYPAAVDGTSADLRALVCAAANTVFLDGLAIDPTDVARSRLYESLALALCDVVILVVSDLVALRSSLSQTRARLRGGAVLIVLHNQRRFTSAAVSPADSRIAAVAAEAGAQAHTRPGPTPRDPKVCAVTCSHDTEHHFFLCDDATGSANEGSICAVASTIMVTVPDSSFAAGLSRALGTTISQAHELACDGTLSGDSFCFNATKTHVEPHARVGCAMCREGVLGAAFTGQVIDVAQHSNSPMQRTKVGWKLSQDEVTPSGSEEDEPEAAEPKRRSHVFHFAMRDAGNAAARSRITDQLAWGKGLSEVSGASNPIRVRVKGPGTQLVDAVTSIELSDVGNEHAPVRVRFDAAASDPSLTNVRVIFAGPV